ncbi:hypothetical protein [Bradyrhizobium sp.]|uniref:hypothetical protein n=1 Tax=Bradyrhizobium sp. TaxID=376 RepID=UPI0025BB44F1|nr:hypothetical protein [Bradyrhizobium sp.]
MLVSSKGSGDAVVLPMFWDIVHLCHVNLNPVHGAAGGSTPEADISAVDLQLTRVNADSVVEFALGRATRL